MIAPSENPSGICIVNKPSGPSSHDIVAQARRLFHTRAIGHAGTLDPMASGVLLLLLGEATKLSAALTLDRKSYRATIHFGSFTDSDDRMGNVIESRAPEPGWLTQERLTQALDEERSRTLQIPPQVSAIKQQGVAAYRRQRRGETVAFEPRAVQVHDLRVLSVSDQVLELSLSVSKGYYVRALARDLGHGLSMPAHLAALCRTSSGCFELAEAVEWPRSDVPPLLSISDVVRRSMPTKVIGAEGVWRARRGQRLTTEHFAEAGPDDFAAPAESEGPLCAWLDEQGALVALGKRTVDGTFQVARGFQAAG
ncbi:MAG TPA: tRNA pseudouridine(55) synthase TruB [Polyangiaceae bacterium]|nr:tRNA pseudouridine(55) synthase TruB [Polyangiaceae bacterium]